MSGLSLGTLLSNFKSIALTVFELLAFFFNFRWQAQDHNTKRNKYEKNKNKHAIKRLEKNMAPMLKKRRLKIRI